jgi:anti-anti-sigma regulatory factor
MQNALFTIEVSYPATHVVVLQLSGEFDLVSDESLQQAFSTIPDPASSDLVIDLSQARFISVGVLTQLVLAGSTFRTTTLQSPSRIVTKVLGLLNLPGSHQRDEDQATTPACAEATDLPRRHERPGEIAVAPLPVSGP